MATAPEAATPNPVSKAAKRPQKTQKFMDDLKQALDDFDDEVFSFASEQREVAYQNFATYYRDALITIWPKATDASIKTILKSVTDKHSKNSNVWQAYYNRTNQNRKLSREVHGSGTRTYTWCTDESPSTTNFTKSRSLWAIANIFSDLSTAHGFQAKATQGIAELASLITPEQMTLILAAAVPPTIQIVLPPGSALPLSTPPPPPTTATTEAERQNIIKYCKKNILPDPAANCFAKVDEKAPTRVLAAAIYCTLERKYFDDKTPRAQVAMMFQVTTAQLMKAVTGVDYMSGPHTYIKKRKTSAEPSTSTTAQTPKPTAAKATQEAEDTLSLSSSDLPPL